MWVRTGGRSHLRLCVPREQRGGEILIQNPHVILFQTTPGGKGKSKNLDTARERARWREREKKTRNFRHRGIAHEKKITTMGRLLYIILSTNIFNLTSNGI